MKCLANSIANYFIIWNYKLINYFEMVIPKRFERLALSLKGICSTNWATESWMRFEHIKPTLKKTSLSIRKNGNECRIWTGVTKEKVWYPSTRWIRHLFKSQKAANCAGATSQHSNIYLKSSFYQTRTDFKNSLQLNC